MVLGLGWKQCTARVDHTYRRRGPLGRLLCGLSRNTLRGGVYLWRNIEAAKKAHGPAFEEAIQSIFGSKPEFQYFEATIVIDNAANEVVDNAA